MRARMNHEDEDEDRLKNEARYEDEEEGRR